MPITFASRHHYWSVHMAVPKCCCQQTPSPISTRLTHQQIHDKSTITSNGLSLHIVSSISIWVLISKELDYHTHWYDHDDRVLLSYMSHSLICSWAFWHIFCLIVQCQNWCKTPSKNGWFDGLFEVFANQNLLLRALQKRLILPFFFFFFFFFCNFCEMRPFSKDFFGQNGTYV